METHEKVDVRLCEGSATTTTRTPTMMLAEGACVLFNYSLYFARALSSRPTSRKRMG